MTDVSDHAAAADGVGKARVADSRRWIALTVLALAQVVLVLDSTVVNVALPSIQDQFDLPASELAWIVNGYALAFGGLLLLGGRLSDLYGRRRMFMIGIAVFAVASFFAGIAWDSHVIVVMRVLQGLGAALVAPAALSSISRIFTEPRERARALGVWGGLSALGGTLGVVLSGVLTDLASWRWVFLINVPLALAALILAPKYVPESRAPGRSRVDVVGAILVTAGLGLAVFALLDKGPEPWTDGPVLLRLAGAALLIVAFVVWESRTATPMVPLDIFANRNRSVGVTAIVLFGAVFSTYFFSMSLYMQSVLDYSPLKTGFAYLPYALVVGATFPLVSSMVTRLGLRVIMTFGLLVGASGMLVLTTIDADGTYLADVLPGMVLLAIGASCGFVAFTIAGVDGTTDKNAGIASSIVSAGNQVGGALGLAVLVAIAVSVQADQLLGGADAADASVAGYVAAYKVGAVLLAVGAVIAVTLLRPPDRTPTEHTVPPPT